MVAIDKKLAEKVARERYVVLERGVDKAKEKEKMEMESMEQRMKVQIDEMNEKIENMKGDQYVERQ